jgi:hypothetical protein
VDQQAGAVAQHEGRAVDLQVQNSVVRVGVRMDSLLAVAGVALTASMTN